MVATAPLSELLVDLRAELGQSLNAAQTTQTTPAQRVKLQRAQRVLWQNFAWPHLRTTWDVSLAAGSRYYDIPDTPPGLTLERIERVHVYWSGDWHPVDRGITQEHYSAFDPEQDQRTDPVSNWDERPDGQIEVWPLPASDSMRLRLTGIRGLGPFVEDADHCTLDRDLLVLTVAADLEQNEEKAKRFAARAQALYAKLTGNATTGAGRTFSLVGPLRQYGRYPTPPRVSNNRT